VLKKIARDAAVLYRSVSQVGIVLSLFYLVLGLALALLGSRLLHIAFMAFGFLPSFTYSIASSYVASLARTSASDIAIATAVTWSAPLASLLSPKWPLLLLGLASAYMAVSTAVRYSGRVPARFRPSILAVSAAYGSMGLFGVVAGLTGNLGIVPAGLGVALASAVGMIYAVTWHSLPRTFGDAGSLPGLVALYAAHYSSLAVLALGRTGPALMLLGAGLLLYGFSSNFHRLGRYISASRSAPEGPARKGRLYFAWGHVMVAASIAAVLVLIAAYTAGEARLATLVHAISVGFVGMHIYIHVPMMLPSLFGIRAPGLFTRMPFLLLLVSSLLWPISPQAFMALFVASAALVLINTVPVLSRKISGARNSSARTAFNSR
jgi:hypothetical protein